MHHADQGRAPAFKKALYPVHQKMEIERIGKDVIQSKIRRPVSIRPSSSA